MGTKENWLEAIVARLWFEGKLNGDERELVGNRPWPSCGSLRFCCGPASRRCRRAKQQHVKCYVRTVSYV